MKRLFTACIAAVLVLLCSAFTAFADEGQVIQDEAMTEQATSYVYEAMAQICSLTPEQVDEVISMYLTNGYPEAVTGFSQWGEISSSVGALNDVTDIQVTTTDSDAICIHAMLKFENADVQSMFIVGSSGEIRNLSFQKIQAPVAEGLGQKLKDASINLVVGMGTVFAVLIFLCGVIYLFGFISKAEKALADKKAKKNAQPEVIAEPVIAAVEPAPSTEEELQVVIAAAIAAYEADNGSAISKQPSLANGINIKSYRRN